MLQRVKRVTVGNLEMELKELIARGYTIQQVVCIDQRCAYFLIIYKFN